MTNQPQVVWLKQPICPPYLSTSPQDHVLRCPILITVEQMKQEFFKVNVNKARGPDNINPRVLKLCAGELEDIFQHVFCLSEAEESIAALEDVMYCPCPQEDT